MTYEIQTLTFLNVWENTCTDDGVNPTVFDTHAQAAAELAGFLEDLAHFVEIGHLQDFNPNDYRIRKTP